MRFRQANSNSASLFAMERWMNSNVSRRTAMQLIAGEIAALSASRALGAAQNKNAAPNVVLVLLDDVGYGDFACLGNPVIKTPNIDRLHARSIRFTDFHVSPTCSPTRASLMTGRYNNATGVWHTISGRSLLDPSSVTMAQCFKDSGYKTGIFGKWHLGDNYPSRPNDLGFDEALICGGGGIAQTADYFGNDDMDDSYLHNGKWERYSGFSTDIFFDQAMDFMSERKKKDQPFFCYLATTAAHEPYWSKESDAAPYVGVTGLNVPGFYGMIANLDMNLGRLVDFLDAKSLAENTIFLLCADNGTTAGEGVYNESMRGAKASAYDGGHRVPLFMSWPAGGLQGGRDVPTLAAHIDVLPTLSELCNLKNRGKDVDGTSLRPLLSATGSQWPDRTVVTDSQREDFLTKWKETAVMTQRWRLVNPTLNGDPAKLELYDMPKDPGQAVNVSSKYPEVVRSLVDQYDAWWSRVSANGGQYVRIALGSDQEKSSFLTSLDWHGDDGALKTWNQRQIRTAPIADGFWAVDVTQAGRYRFELRRWPREVDLPINATYTNTKPNQRDKTPVVAIAAVSARLMIGDIDQKKEIHPTDKFAEFVVELPKGPAGLRTAFYEADLAERGAYYVYAERL
jgi:arylsulfatase A-like enzyme